MEEATASQDRQGQGSSTGVPLIAMRGVGKVYHTGAAATRALEAIDLEVRKGDFLAIMGPSGCGKSTLLNLIGLLDDTSEGTYAFMGRPVGDLGERERAGLRRGHIGFIFQNFNLIDEMSVGANIDLAVRYQDWPEPTRRARVAELLERLDLAHLADHAPTDLSGGQQQKVAIARALAPRPDLLLADEPTGNLDTRTGEAVMQLLSEINAAGTTLVMVTHSHLQAQHAARTLNLLDGRIVAENLRGRATGIARDLP